jgi:hypothetical protein
MCTTLLTVHYAEKIPIVENVLAFLIDDDGDEMVNGTGDHLANWTETETDDSYDDDDDAHDYNRDDDNVNVTSNENENENASLPLKVVSVPSRV